nr:MAG TPA_asm: hypothetical protein [Caudoviricetes sp.]
MHIAYPALCIRASFQDSLLRDMKPRSYHMQLRTGNRIRCIFYIRLT